MMKLKRNNQDQFVYYQKKGIGYEVGEWGEISRFCIDDDSKNYPQHQHNKIPCFLVDK